MPLVLIFLVLPLVEIALFIVIGGRLGLWPTLALIVLGGIVGILVLRANRARAAQVMQRGLQGISGGTFLAQGAFQVVAGMLLILPGFLTDALGLLLLVPPVQRLILRRLRSRVEVHAVHLRTRREPGGEIIEGEYEARDEPDRDRWLDDRGGH
jgi:UPF0716 protein FxsA